MGKDSGKTPPSKGAVGEKKKSLPLWIWLALLLVLVLIAGAVLAYFLFNREKEPDLPEELALPLAVPDEIAGLWRPPVMQIPVRVEGEIRLPLRLAIAILAADQPDAMMTLLRQKDAILAAVQVYLEKGKAEDWEDVGGKLRLKYALTGIVNGFSGGSPIRALYITDYMLLLPI